MLKVKPLAEFQSPRAEVEPTTRISSPQVVEAVTSNVMETNEGAWHGLGVLVGLPFMAGQLLIVARLYVPGVLVARQVEGRLGVPVSPHGGGATSFRR